MDGSRAAWWAPDESTPATGIVDYAVVMSGVASFLAAEHIDVVETVAMMAVNTDADIVLHGTFGQVQGDGIDLEDFVRDSGAKVVIYRWNLQPGRIAEAVASDTSGYLSIDSVKTPAPPTARATSNAARRRSCGAWRTSSRTRCAPPDPALLVRPSRPPSRPSPLTRG